MKKKETQLKNKNKIQNYHSYNHFSLCKGEICFVHHYIHNLFHVFLCMYIYPQYHLPLRKKNVHV